MNKGHYQGSIIGSTMVLILVCLLGGISSLIIVNKWDLPTGETVALLLAAGAFFSSFYHFHAQRRYHKLSVKPYLQIYSSFDSVTKTGFYTLRVQLQNVGLGPAIIENKSMKLGGIQTNNIHDEFEEWVKLVNRITPANGNAECRSSRCEAAQAIDKGSVNDLLIVNFPENDMSFMDARDVAMELSRNIEIQIKYKSHYGQNYECTK